MILKDIYFQVKPFEYKDQDGRNDDRLYAKDASRHIFNYLGRSLKKLKFETDGYDRIVFNGFKNPDNSSNYPDNQFRILSTKVLSVPIKFDLDAFKNLKSTEISDFFYFLFTDGFKMIAKFKNIPLDFILNDLARLKNNNYINQWIFKEKSFLNKKIKCTLACSMGLEKFHLRLIVKSKSEIIFDEEILTTPPDEISYHHKFKSIELLNNQISVLDFLKKPIFQMTLPALSTSI